MKTLLAFALATAAFGAAAQAQPAGPPAAPLAVAAAPALRNGVPALTTTDGVRLYAKVAGRGLPCVFVHGGPGSGSEAVEKLAGPGLEENFQMIYLDQRGSGRSASASDGNYALDRLVQDLEELRQQLHVARWVVMAHSFGGIIAAAYARQYPAHVQGLVLANSVLNLPAMMASTVAHGYARLPAAGRPPLDPAAPLPQRFGTVMGLLAQQKLLSKFTYAHDSTETRIKKALLGTTANQDFARAVFQSAAGADYLQDFTAATAGLAMPVLVLTGREDYLVGPDHYRSFRFPHQQVVVLPGKHFAMLENPAEFNQAVAAFARRLPGRN